MRKVSIEAIVEVPVVIKALVSLIVYADDGADVDKAVSAWAAGRKYGKADVVAHEHTIHAVGGVEGGHEDMGEVLDQALSKEGAKVKLLTASVVDSK